MSWPRSWSRGRKPAEIDSCQNRELCLRGHAVLTNDVISSGSSDAHHNAEKSLRL